MATHHETVGGSGEPLEIPINEVFTFQGPPDKWGFTVPRFMISWIQKRFFFNPVYLFVIVVLCGYDNFRKNSKIFQWVRKVKKNRLCASFSVCTVIIRHSVRNVKNLKTEINNFENNNNLS